MSNKVTILVESSRWCQHKKKWIWHTQCVPLSGPMDGVMDVLVGILEPGSNNIFVLVKAIVVRPGLEFGAGSRSGLESELELLVF